MEISLSRHSWHAKYYNFVKGHYPTYEFKSLCPYFWTILTLLLLSPVIVLWKVFNKLVIKPVGSAINYTIHKALSQPSKPRKELSKFSKWYDRRREKIGEWFGKVYLITMGLIALILSIFNFNTSLPNVVLTGSGGLKFIFDFIVKLILYIPCLIIDCSNVIREQINLAKKEYTVLIIFIIELLLIGSKFLVPKLFNNIINNDGIPITNKVYPLEMKNQVMIPPILQNMPKKSNYGVSSWIYLHPVPDNTNVAYIQNTSLINVGFVPDIQFNAQKGTLIFAVDVTDSNGGKRTVIVPSKESGKEIQLLYSRWNHVFVNFMDGGIDIFINGELVVSAPDVIPYQNPGGIIIGSSPGIYGEMCSLVYYKNPILAQNIKLMYQAMKGFNPPVAQ